MGINPLTVAAAVFRYSHATQYTWTFAQVVCKGPSINQDIFVGQNSCNNIFFIIHSYTESSSQVRLVYLLSNFKLFLSNILQGSPEIIRSFNDALTKKLFFSRSYVSYDFLIISSYTPIQIMVRREVFKIWYPVKDKNKTIIKIPFYRDKVLS